MSLLPIDGVPVYFEELGAGSPVVFLHGLGSSGQDFRFVAPRLAASHRVIIPDIRGHGRSGKPDGAYSVPLFAHDIATLCDRLGLTSVHVVGLSMGGMIGFQLAVDRPALVRSLIIINSGPDMVPRTLRLKLAFATRLALLKLFGPRALARVIAPKLFPKPEQVELRRAISAQLAGNDPSAYLRATRGLIGWSVLDRLADVRCPVLVLSSDRDYTPHAAKQAYVDRLAHARLHELHDSGHAAPLDQPLQIIDAATTFLSALEPQPRTPVKDASDDQR
jgi:3-oxoadipate enol-lactonase